MELYQLRYFLAAAEAGNFTRAAARCHISQPSLSLQIIHLERELGHKLFHRLGRRVVPTEAGQVFLERARDILSKVEDASKELKDSPTLERHIKVGTVPTIAPYLLPPVLEHCRKLHPNLLVHTHEDFRPDLMRGVIEGDLDLAIVPQPVKDPRVSTEVLFTEPLLLVVSRSHPLAIKPAITARDLADESFVLLGHSSTLAMEIERFCGDHHFAPQLGHRCSQVATVKALVALGQGISILPQIAHRPEDKKTLVYRKLTGHVPIREVVIVRHWQRYQTKGAELFLKVLRASVAGLTAMGEVKGRSVVKS
ncbi:MAG: LysR family transcriptional regulator [Opitutaceae bacterium]|jgi:LysR family hydrogen peroxide-inducible transcriptional activator